MEHTRDGHEVPGQEEAVDQAALKGKSFQTIFTLYTSACDTHPKLLKTKSVSGAQCLTERESLLRERFKIRKVLLCNKAAFVFAVEGYH